MALLIPSTGTTWKKHEIIDRGCFSISVPPERTVKLFMELPLESAVKINVSVGEHASLELLTTQEGGVGTVTAQARIAAGGSLHWRPVMIGGTVTHEVTSVCTGPGARSMASWIVVAGAGEYPHAIMHNTFSARDGGGEVSMRAVARAEGRILLDGCIAIGEGGGGTQTYLTQEALMVDPSARIEFIPSLEIKTNDVKASHSATVSRVHPDDLFYAGSRGIAPKEARRLLVEGFLGKLLQGIGDEALQERILQRIIAVMLRP